MNNLTISYYRPVYYFFLFLALVFFLNSNNLFAEKYAVIVGVWDYTHPDNNQYDLRGPENDALTILKLAQGAGFKSKNIVVLTDKSRNIDWAYSGKVITPTRKNIMLSMEALAKKVKPGDYVLLYFAGHGSQQPVSKTNPDPSELDGLDEIFLPADIGKWDETIGTVKNAIVDNEFNQIFTKIRRNGVFLWAIFDACFSGNMEKGARSLHVRRITPSSLGVPAKKLVRMKHSLNTRKELSDYEYHKLKSRLKNSKNSYSSRKSISTGGLIVFSAAQSDQIATERKIKSGKLRQPGSTIDTQALYQGVFTRTIALQIYKFPDITYRTLEAQIRYLYSTQLHQRNISTPSITCPEPYCSSVVFFNIPRKKLFHWKIIRANKSLRLNGGLLRGVSEGSILAVLPYPAASQDKTLGYIKVTKVDPLFSTITPISYNGKKALSPNSFNKILYARFYRINSRIKLTVALPNLYGNNNKFNKRIHNILNKVRRQLSSRVLLQWVPSGHHADIYLSLYYKNKSKKWVTDKKLRILPFADAMVQAAQHNSHLISTTSSNYKVEQRLLDSLIKTAQLYNLIKLSKYYLAEKTNFKVKIIVQRHGNNQELVLDNRLRPKHSGLGKIRHLTKVRDKDKFFIDVSNKTNKTYNLSVFGVSSDYEIRLLYPSRDHTGFSSNQIPQGYNGRKYVSQESTDTVGIERLIVIATENLGNNENYAFLEQPGVHPMRANRKSSTHSDLVTMLYNAKFGSATKNSVRRNSDLERKGFIKVFTFITEK